MVRFRVLLGLFISLFLTLGISSTTLASGDENPFEWEYQCCKGHFIHPSLVPFQCIDTTLTDEKWNGYAYTGFIFHNIKNQEKYIVKNETKYYGWCADQNVDFYTGVPYCTKLYSPAIISVKRRDGKPVEWDKVLYILNHRDGYNVASVQKAIWYYLQGIVFDSPDFQGIPDRHQELIDAAEAYGDGYVPSAGEKTILLADVSFKNNCSKAQPHIIEIDIPECKGTHTIGYWKKHPGKWPVDSLVLGTQTYSKSELLDILHSPSHGDASLILAKQLIAAKLNILAGADPVDIVPVIDEADALIDGLSIPAGISPSSDEGSQMVQLADILDNYNKDFKGCKIKKKKTCGCKKIYSMTMKYLDTTSATSVKAYDKHGDLVGEFPLNPDGTFFVSTVVKPEMTFVIGDDCITIHTSCSKPIGPGMVFGKLKILDWNAKLKSCKHKKHKKHKKKKKCKDDDDDDDDDHDNDDDD